MNQLSLFDRIDNAPLATKQPSPTPPTTTAIASPARQNTRHARRRGEMRTIRRDGEWWIINIPVPDVTENGPYDRRDDADSDLDGLQKFFARNPGYAAPNEAA